MRCFSLTLYTILFLMLPLMVNAQKTEEPDVIMTDSSIQILDPVSQVPDSLKREKAKDTNIILESFSNMEKIDVDYKKIEEFVKKNPKGYKDLMKRFLDNPLSLSVEEVVKLYYGYPFTNGYNPNRVDALTKPTRLMLSGELQGALDVCEKELRKAPVSLALLEKASFLVHELKAPSRQKYVQRTMKLLSALMASGTGFSKEDAVKVIYISDEYAVFREMMGLVLSKQEFVERRYDRMTLNTGNGGESIILWYDTYLMQEWCKKHVR